MLGFERITFNPDTMGGKACIRGMRLTVGAVLEMLASGHDTASILRTYPYLETEDIAQALAYAAWRVEEREMDIPLQ